MLKPKPITAGALRLKTQGAYVYRVRGKASELLYIGITNDMPTRFVRHLRFAEWWPEAHSVTWDEYRTREEAAAVELALIDLFKPPYNVKGIKGSKLKKYRLSTSEARIELGHQQGLEDWTAKAARAAGAA